MSPEKLGLNRIPNAPAPFKKKVGRPKNEKKRVEEKDYKFFKAYDSNQHRTKSGRPVINPAHNQFPFETAKPYDDVYPKSQTHTEEAPKKQRKISSQFRCSFCKKIYLGKNKMNHHYKNFPNHRSPQCENESNLFKILFELVRKKRTNKEMASVFFQEISSFVQLCEKLTPKLITNQDNINTHQQIIDKNAASLLRINPGNYKINMNVFDKTFKFDNPSHGLATDDIEGSQISSQTIHNDSTAKPLIIIEDVPSLDENECSSLLIKANELTNLTNISLETEDF